MVELDRRQFLQRAAAAGLGVTFGSSILAACGDESSPRSSGGGGRSTPLKVGVMVPLTGVYAALGQTQRNGFELYLKEHNGRIAERPVELIVEDAEGNPEVGVRKAQKLLTSDRVDVLVGIINSAIALAIRDLVHEARIPLIVTLANANAITREQKSPFIFRTSFTSWQMSHPAGQWMVKNVSQDGIFATAPNYVAGQEYVKDFREGVEEAGGRVAGQQLPPFGTTQDYQPFLAQIRNSGAKAVWAFYGGSEAISFVKQYDEFGLKNDIPLVAHGVVLDEQILPALGRSALGIRSQSTYTPMLDTPVNKRFVDAYTSTYNKEPNFVAVHSWDALQLLEEALKKTDGNTEDGDALIDALETARVESPRGPFEIDPKTHNPVQKFYMREVREVNGKLANVVIEDLGSIADPG